MLRQLAILMLLAHCACDVPHPVPAPPGEQAALEIAAAVYAEAGEPVDLSAVSVSWWGGECLASVKIDTEHWSLRESCVHGVALGCALQVIRPVGATPIARSAAAHELYHCEGFQAAGGRIEGLDIEHTRPGWKTTVPLARQRIAEAGL